MARMQRGRQISDNLPVLRGALGFERKARVGSGTLAGDKIGHVLPHRRAVFEPVARAAAGQPDVFQCRVTVQQKIAVGGVLPEPESGVRKPGATLRAGAFSGVGGHIGDAVKHIAVIKVRPHRKTHRRVALRQAF